MRYRGRKILDLAGSAVLAARGGPRIVIVGSGPSVRAADIGMLPPRSAFLLNGAISLIGQDIAEPFAVAIEEERFVWRHFPLIAARVPQSVPLLLSVGALRAICELDIGFLGARSIVLIDDIRKPYGLPRRETVELDRLDFVRRREDAGFSVLPDAGVFQGGSVVVSALQFALITAVTEVGFIGVDIRNANAPRFYEQPDAAAFSGVAGAEQRILAHIALARDVASARGIRLVNHSPISTLADIGLDYEPLGVIAS